MDDPIRTIWWHLSLGYYVLRRRGRIISAATLDYRSVNNNPSDDIIQMTGFLRSFLCNPTESFFSVVIPTRGQTADEKRQQGEQRAKFERKILIILGQYVVKEVNGASCDETLATAALH